VELLKHPGRYKALVLLAVAIVAIALLPWRQWVQAKLQAVLEAKGFQNVHLMVAGLGFHGVELQDISIGNDPPLILHNLTVGFSLSDLWHGNAHELNLKGLTFEARKRSDKWVIAGWNGKSDRVSSGAATSIPVSSAELAAVPLDNAKIENSELHATTDDWQLTVPLQATWQKTPEPKLSVQGSSVEFKAADIGVSTGKIILEMKLDEKNKQWKGLWQVADIRMADATIPALQGAGLLIIKSDTVRLGGQFNSSDNSYKVAFAVDYALNAPEKSRLTLVDAAMPWSGGTLSVEQMAVPLAGKQAVKAMLGIDKVSVGAVMESLTGKRATATGVISGTLPVTLGADGVLTIQQGKLEADAPGTIAMSPDAIPGDNEQIALVREILKDLHYKLLSVEVESDKGGKLSVLMSLEGNNPAVYAGRPVKLNVHLAGDVLDFIRQSVMSFADPKKFLKQGDNVKK
jgi:hypothetical protein